MGILDPQSEHADKGVSTYDLGSGFEFRGSRIRVRSSEVRSSELGDRSSNLVFEDVEDIEVLYTRKMFSSRAFTMTSSQSVPHERSLGLGFAG